MSKDFQPSDYALFGYSPDASFPEISAVMPVDPPDPPPFDARLTAKRLLRLARTGALATVDAPDGAPLTTLVGVASDWDGSPLFLISQLSRHTRNLALDARASLLVASERGRGDPLNLPRLTVGGLIAPHPDPTSRERYLQRNPKSRLYASFADFSIQRLRIETVHFNGGFGRAEPMSVDDLLAPAGKASALVAAEDSLVEEVRGLGADRIARLVAGASPGRRVWRPVELDVEGLDLASGGTTARIDFSAPAFDPSTWRQRLVERLAQNGVS